MALIPLMTLQACSSDSKDEPDAPPQTKSKALSISTSIQTKAVVQTAFASGDKMNLYVKSASSVTSENYAAASIQASYDGSQWSLSPTVELVEGKEAYVTAFYPYASGASDPAAVPVSIETQTDYLYSGSAVRASYTSSQAQLTMKHALPIIAFNLSKEGISEEVALKSIAIKGESFYLQGTLDITNGQLKGTNKGTYTLTVNQSVTAEGWKESTPECFCLPFNSSGQNITLTLLFADGEQEITLPKINVEGGMKYVFRLALTPQGLSVFPDLTEVISLNKGTEGSTLNGYGLLRFIYEGTQINAPQITGSKAVSGTIYWGDKASETYQSSLTHSYATSDQHEVSIECWGGESVTVSNLQQLAEIDLTDF